MLRKVTLVIGTAAVLGMLGYTAMAFRMVTQSNPLTVVSFAASDTIPLAPRLIAEWRVRSWDGCPAGERNQNPLGMTLRGYGMEGFNNDRILAAANRLIELGCHANQRNFAGYTALHEAILYNEPAVVGFLLAHGADPAVTIEIPELGPPELRRLFSGMDSIEFTKELQRSASQGENRGEVLRLLQQSRG